MVVWVLYITIFVRPTWIHYKLSGAGFFRSPNALMFIWKRMQLTFRWVVTWRTHTTFVINVNLITDIFFCTKIFLNPCKIMHNTLLPCCKCYRSARCELGFLMKGIHLFLADIFKSCVQLKSQLFSCSSLKRPNPRRATWKTYKTPSERSSSVIRACHCQLCWSRSKSWRYCHSHLTGCVLLSLEVSCPLQIPNVNPGVLWCLNTELYELETVRVYSCPFLRRAYRWISVVLTCVILFENSDFFLNLEWAQQITKFPTC